MNTNELQTLLDDTARDIAQNATDPAQWAQWIGYLLEVLEVAAMDLDPNHPELYELVLSDLAGSIATRLEEGRW